MGLMPKNISDTGLAARAVRILALLAFWLVLTGFSGADLIAGLATATLTGWISLRLVPPGTLRVRLTGLARLAGRFVRQSLVAGWDVARRALSPRLPLSPGLLAYKPRQPGGLARDGFTALSSLLPGTVPVGAQAAGEVIYHCLDLTQPVAAQLAADEAVYAAAVIPGTEPAGSAS